MIFFIFHQKKVVTK